MKSYLKLTALLLTLGTGATCMAQTAPGSTTTNNGTTCPKPGHGGKRLEHMKEALGLSDDQVAKIKAIFESRKGQPHDAAAREQTEQEINAVLTPDQQAKWAQIRAEHKEHHAGGSTSNTTSGS